MNNLELNKIYCESNLETMLRMQDKSVDYVLTSPPYNVGKNGLNGEGKKYNGFNDISSEYYQEQKTLISELLRITKKHIFYNTQMLANNKIDFLNLLGFFSDKIKDIIIWEKNPIPHIEAGIFNSAFEFIIIFSNDYPNKKKFYDANFKQGTQSNVFKIKNSHSNPFSDVHKAIMPLDIPRYFMQNFGKEQDLWFDPYMGTGTTAVAAIMENKKFIGSEISQEYIDLANKRIEPYLTQQTLF
jgi:site-specific DNA-methyltransferase (adenine-specific)/modification methylase